MSIGARLKEIRIKLNLTAKNLADEIGIPVRTIGGYERNENPPNQKFLTQLAIKYNINLNWFLTGKGNMFVSNSDDIVQMISDKFNIAYDTALSIVKLVENNTTREIVVEFLKAKEGNKDSIDILIHKLSGMKLAFS